MLPQRRFAGEKTPIRAAEWNQLVEPTSKLGTSTPKRVELSDVAILQARNDTGYTLAPGAPALLGTFTGDGTEYGNWKKGWSRLHPCYLPSSATELTNLSGRQLFNLAVAVDEIANNATGKVIVAGTCEVRAQYTGEPCVRPHLLTGSYQTQMRGDVFGFRVLGTTATNTVLINLDSWQMPNLFGTTTAAIAADAWGTVTADTRDYPVRNQGGSLASGATVVLMPSLNHYRALRYC